MPKDQRRHYQDESEEEEEEEEEEETEEEGSEEEEEEEDTFDTDAAPMPKHRPKGKGGGRVSLLDVPSPAKGKGQVTSPGRSPGVPRQSTFQMAKKPEPEPPKMFLGCIPMGSAEATDDQGQTWRTRRLWYLWDSYISQAKYQSYLLLLMAAVLSLLGGGIFALVDPMTDFGDGVWYSWTWITQGVLSTHLGTRGAALYLEDGTGTGSRITASIITVLGILYFSVVLGLVVEAVQAKMNALRKGKTKVVEKEHTVMLGWTDKSLSFVNEIVNANESQGGGVIAVLVDRDKEDMEEEFKNYHNANTLRGTKMVFRKGSALMISDLFKVCVEDARAVVILSDNNKTADAADAEVLQVCLNLQNIEMAGHVVAEVRDKDNEPLIHLIGQGNIESIVSHDIIGRLMLMSVRQPGLAQVYDAVLGFEGDEFYIADWPELVGSEWGDTPFRFPDAIPIGIRKGGEGGEIVLNPEHSYRIEDEDEVIVIAEDDDTYKPEKMMEDNNGKKAPSMKIGNRFKEKVFFAGWRRDIRDMIILLDKLCTGGSELHILDSLDLESRTEELESSGLNDEDLKHIDMVHHVGNTNERGCVEGLEDITKYTSVVIFADDTTNDIMQSDSKALSTLLLVRDMMTKDVGGEDAGFWEKEEEMKKVPIVTEVLDPRTQETIQKNPNMRKLSYFLQSNNLVSKILAMVAENRAVAHILNTLLAPQGAALACEKASKFCREGEEISFVQMAQRCQAAGLILVGYAEPAEDDEDDEDVVFGFRPPQINAREKMKRQSWDGFNLCVLSGGPATDEINPPKPQGVRASQMRAPKKKEDEGTPGAAATAAVLEGIEAMKKDLIASIKLDCMAQIGVLKTELKTALETQQATQAELQRLSQEMAALPPSRGGPPTKGGMGKDGPMGMGKGDSPMGKGMGEGGMGRGAGRPWTAGPGGQSFNSPGGPSFNSPSVPGPPSTTPQAPPNGPASSAPPGPQQSPRVGDQGPPSSWGGSAGGPGSNPMAQSWPGPDQNPGDGRMVNMRGVTGGPPPGGASVGSPSTPQQLSMSWSSAGPERSPPGSGPGDGSPSAPPGHLHPLVPQSPNQGPSQHQWQGGPPPPNQVTSPTGRDGKGMGREGPPWQQMNGKGKGGPPPPHNMNSQQGAPSPHQNMHYQNPQMPPPPGGMLPPPQSEPYNNIPPPMPQGQYPNQPPPHDQYAHQQQYQQY